MAFALPAFLAGIFGGVMVDRVGGRTMAIFSDAMSAVGVAAIPLCFQIGVLPFWLFLGFTFTSAIFDIPGITARRVMLPEMSARHGILPERMNSWFEVMQSVSVVIGPAIAGFMIARIGALDLLWVNAATFFVSAALLTIFNRGVGERDATAEAHERGMTAWGTDILVGLRFLRKDVLLLLIALILTVFNFLGAPVTIIVIPVYIEQLYGTADRLGLLLMILGVGNLLGGLAFAWIGHQLRPWRRQVLIIGLSVWGLMQWLLVADLALWALLTLIFLAGFLEGPVSPLLVTVRMERIPVALRGRVFGSFTALAQITAPLGMAFAGGILEGAGLDRGIVILSILYTLLVIGLILLRPLALMNRATDDAVP
jgi:MFS family permease